MTFASTFNVINEEYLLYNFCSITTAVGGAVGLFVGVSIYNCFDFVIQSFFKKQNKRPSSSTVLKVEPGKHTSMYM